MKRRVTIDSIVTVFLAVAVSLTSTASQAVCGQDPQPVGARLSTTISFGDEYTSSVELYDVGITVLETVRGPKAWDRLAMMTASKPKSGFEYLLARVRFDFSARGLPGDKRYVLTESQFSVFSEAGTEYPAAHIEELEPKLRGTLSSGESVEGWMAFLLPQEDKGPVLNFTEDVQSVLRAGTGIRFKLY